MIVAFNAFKYISLSVFVVVVCCVAGSLGISLTLCRAVWLQKGPNCKCIHWQFVCALLCVNGLPLSSSTLRQLHRIAYGTIISDDRYFSSSVAILLQFKMWCILRTTSCQMTITET